MRSQRDNRAETAGVLCFGNGGEGPQPGNTDRHGSLGETRKWLLPSEPPEGASPGDTLSLAQ